MDAFSTFAPTYGSMFKMLVYKLDIIKEPKFTPQLRMLTALTFLPPQDVARGFAAVCIEI